MLLQLGEYRLVPDAPGVNAGALVPIVSAASAIGARAGGANVLRATARVRFWGALAMVLVAGIRNFSGTVV